MHFRIIVCLLSPREFTFNAVKIREMKSGGFVMKLNAQKATQTKNLFNECTQCGNALIAPIRSGLRERGVRHLWNCDACGSAFETTVYLAPRAKAQQIVDAVA